MADCDGGLDVEDVEDLLLEAYNSMQSDGEHIFLPDDVADKLHHIARLVRSAGLVSDDEEGLEEEEDDDDADVDDVDPYDNGNLMQPHGAGNERGVDPVELQNPSPQSVEDNARRSECHGEDEAAEPQEATALSSNQIDTILPVGIQDARGSNDADESPIEFAALPIRIEPRHLEPVIEECTSSSESETDVVSTVPPKECSADVDGDANPAIDDEPIAEPSNQQDDEPVSPAKTLSPPRDCMHKPSIASPSKPTSLLKKPEIRRRSSLSLGASSPRKPTTTTPRSSASGASRLKKEDKSSATSSSGSSTREQRSSSTSYEQRREAARKIKEERAQRELHAREAARKQREESKRQLEAAQQKELAAKRERVQRMKMLKEQHARSSGGSATRSSKGGP